jgi:mannose-6-phosphate isomerase-like protein (cupin superfamily)
MRDAEIAAPSRHLIFGVDDDGRSAVSHAADHQRTNAAGEWAVSVLWAAQRVPASNSHPTAAELADGLGPLPRAIMPGHGGLTFLRCELQPGERQEESAATAIEAVTETTGDAQFIRRPDLHPGMHATHTLDLHVVFSGELTLILETETVTLKPGDSAVLRGGQHAWENRGANPAIWYCVVVDAEPLNAKPA